MGKSGTIGWWQEGEVLRRNWTDAAGWNLVIREWLPAGAVRVTRGRVVDRCGRGAQIAGAEGHGRNRRQGDLSHNVPATLIVGEKEQFIPDEPPSGGTAELIVNAMRHCGGKNVSGLQVAVAMVFEHAAMKIVAARFHDDVNHSAARAA